MDASNGARALDARILKMEARVAALEEIVGGAAGERKELRAIATELRRDLVLLKRILNGDADLGYKGLRDELRSLQAERRQDLRDLRAEMRQGTETTNSQLSSLSETVQELRADRRDELNQRKGIQYTVKFLTGTSGVSLLGILGIFAKLLGLF